VRLTWLKFGLLLMIEMIAVVAPRSGAQINITDNTEINLAGNASFGFSDVMSNVPSVQSSSSNQIDFGGDLDLRGYYYHPNFLSFQVRPYYNQTRLNSDFNSIFGGKGITAGANLFSGSAVPGTIEFEKSYNNEQQLSVPGTSGFVANGDFTAFNVGWGFLFNRLPSVHVNFGLNKSSADILGTSAHTSGRSRVFNISSNYSLLGFNLNGSYSNMFTVQHVPEVADFAESQDNKTHQNLFIFSASRRLSSWAYWNTTFNRTHFTTDFTGTPTDQTYNSINSNVTMHPAEKLDVSASVNYASNLNALILGSVLPGAPNSPQSPVLIPTTTASDIENYDVRADYRLTNDLTIDGGAQWITEHFSTADLHGNSANASLGYGHRFLGGQFGAYYGFGRYSSETSLPNVSLNSAKGNSTTTQMGGASYSHSFQVVGWHGDARGNYSRNAQTVILLQTSTTYGGSMSIGRELGKTWDLTLNSSISKSKIDGLSNGDSMGESFGAGLARRKLSFGGSYSKSNGNSLQTLAGLTPVPLPGQVLFPGLLVRYGSESYSGSVSYNPRRKFRIYANLIHSTISTDNQSSRTNSLFLRYDVRTDYTLRQLHFTGGYSHISQGVGASLNLPAKVDAIYFGISRHFDIF